MWLSSYQFMPIWGPVFLVKAEDNVEKIVIADPVFTKIVIFLH